VPDGEYQGVVVDVQRGPSPWPPRKLAEWERAEGRRRRKDWGCFYHVELVRALKAEQHRQLEQWAALHGRRPILFHACHYYTLEGSTKPLPPARSSNLWRLLVLARPGTSMVGETIPFRAPVGMGCRVRVGTVQKDRDGDRLDPTSPLTYSLVRKVLALWPAGSVQQSPDTEHQPAVRDNQHSQQRDESFRAVAKSTNGGPAVSHASRLGIVGRAVAVPTAAVDPRFGLSTAAEAEDLLVGAYVPRAALSEQERKARLAARFGAHDEVAPRGPCTACGDLRFGRPGESGWCPRCDG
jgi:hypothetical protein